MIKVIMQTNNIFKADFIFNSKNDKKIKDKKIDDNIEILITKIKLVLKNKKIKYRK